MKKRKQVSKCHLCMTPYQRTVICKTCLKACCNICTITDSYSKKPICIDCYTEKSKNIETKLYNIDKIIVGAT